MGESIILAIVGSGLLSTIISWIFKRLDRKKDKQDAILSSLAKLSNDLQAHIDGDREKDATEARTKILQFSDEVRRGILHSQESWEQRIDDCDTYLKYCGEHPNYQNSKATLSIQNIRTVYAKCLSGEYKFLE